MTVEQGIPPEGKRGMQELTLWASTRRADSLHDVNYMLGAFTSLSVGLVTLLTRSGASFEETTEVLSAILAKALHDVDRHQKSKEEE